MLKIGLTGGIASGKSTVCALFEHYSVPVIDADLIARRLVEPNEDAYSAIIAVFGQNIIKNNGKLNRIKLRNLIFSDPFAKQQLEKILHPKICRQLILQGQQQQTSYCIFAIPLLIESNMKSLVDRVLVIDLNVKQQLQRLQKRDAISHSQARLMIEAQCDHKQRLANADDIINNNGVTDALNKQVKTLHHKYNNLAKSCQHSNSQGQ